MPQCAFSSKRILYIVLSPVNDIEASYFSYSCYSKIKFIWLLTPSLFNSTLFEIWAYFPFLFFFVIFILGYLNFHQAQWLSSSFEDEVDKLAYQLCVHNDLQRFPQLATLITYRLGNELSILNILRIFNLLNYFLFYTTKFFPTNY